MLAVLLLEWKWHCVITLPLLASSPRRQSAAPIVEALSFARRLLFQAGRGLQPHNFLLVRYLSTASLHMHTESLEAPALLAEGGLAQILLAAFTRALVQV